MTLLSICQDAAKACGFSPPTSVVNSSDKTAMQLLVLANLQGDELSKSRNWSALVSEHTLTLATGDQDYSLPPDFRWIVPNTTWDRSDKRIVLNPISGEEWQFLKAWGSISGLTRRVRIRAGQLEFEETITASDNGKTIAFEYLSKYWAASAALAPKEKFTIDTDVSLLDESLMLLGLIWRFRRAKGLEYETEENDYRMQVQLSKSADSGSKRINMGSKGMFEITNPNIPDRDFG
jgi:hypothetical protein